MSNRVLQVKKIQEMAEQKAIELARAKKEKEAQKELTPPVRVKKTGCNFCSLCRKKIKNGIAYVAQALIKG